MATQNFETVKGIINSIDNNFATIDDVRNEGPVIANLFCKDWSESDFVRLVNAFPGNDNDLMRAYAKSIMATYKK